MRRNRFAAFATCACVISGAAAVAAAAQAGPAAGAVGRSIPTLSYRTEQISPLVPGDLGVPPEVFADAGGGGVTALWQTHYGGWMSDTAEIDTRSLNPNGTWGAITNLSGTSTRDMSAATGSSLGLVRNSAGGGIASWGSVNDGGLLATRATAQSAWRLAPAPPAMSGPEQLVRGPHGTVTALTADTDGVRVTTYTPGKGWGKTTLVAHVGVDGGDPADIAENANGMIVVESAQLLNFNSSGWAPGVINVAVKRPGSSSWQLTPALVHTNNPEADVPDQDQGLVAGQLPEIALTNTNQVAVTWSNRYAVLRGTKWVQGTVPDGATKTAHAYVEGLTASRGNDATFIWDRHGIQGSLNLDIATGRWGRSEPIKLATDKHLHLAELYGGPSGRITTAWQADRVIFSGAYTIEQRSSLNGGWRHTDTIRDRWKKAGQPASLVIVDRTARSGIAVWSDMHSARPWLSAVYARRIHL